MLRWTFWSKVAAHSILAICLACLTIVGPRAAISRQLLVGVVLTLLANLVIEYFRAAAFDRMVIDLNEAQQANQRKSAFLANVSHELRTPLNGILGMTYLALETQVTEEQRDYLSTVQALSASVLKISNDILDLCKIEAGKMSLDPVAFDLRKELGDVLKSVSYAAREKGLRLTLDVPERIPDRLMGDSLRLNQILLNIMSNAVKFTARGEVHLLVAERPSAGGRCTLLFAVADTGIGIPAEALRKIFDPFTQADNSTARNYGGTGLGLTICSKLVRMLGGEIWIESKPNAGTKVFFTASFDVSPAKLSYDELSQAPLIDQPDTSPSGRRHFSLTA